MTSVRHSADKTRLETWKKNNARSNITEQVEETFLQEEEEEEEGKEEEEEEEEDQLTMVSKWRFNDVHAVGGLQQLEEGAEDDPPLLLFLRLDHEQFNGQRQMIAIYRSEMEFHLKWSNTPGELWREEGCGWVAWN